MSVHARRRYPFQVTTRSTLSVSYITMIKQAAWFFVISATNLNHATGIEGSSIGQKRTPIKLAVILNPKLRSKVLNSGFWKVVNAGDTVQPSVRDLRPEWHQSLTDAHYGLELRHRDQ